MNPVHCVDSTIPNLSGDPDTTLQVYNTLPSGSNRQSPAPPRATEQSLPNKPSSSFPYGRWDIWRPRPGQHPTDAIAQWKVKAKAEVDWVSTAQYSNNMYIHTVIPHLSCLKAQPLSDRRGHALALPYNDNSQLNTTVNAAVREWMSMNPSYELIEFWTNAGRDGLGQNVVSVMICYRLSYLPITDCWGVGPDLKTAKADAAQKLFANGHCMIYLSK